MDNFKYRASLVKRLEKVTRTTGDIDFMDEFPGEHARIKANKFNRAKLELVEEKLREIENVLGIE